MIQFINKITGTDMWVADNRYDEYIAAGHKPAVEVKKAENPTKKIPKKTTKK